MLAYKANSLMMVVASNEKCRIIGLIVYDTNCWKFLDKFLYVFQLK